MYYQKKIKKSLPNKCICREIKCDFKGFGECFSLKKKNGENLGVLTGIPSKPGNPGTPVGP